MYFLVTLQIYIYRVESLDVMLRNVMNISFGLLTVNELKQMVDT
jgi:hypothetical protein